MHSIFQPNNGFRWKSPTLLFTDSAPSVMARTRALAQVSTVRHRHSHSLLSYRSVVEAPPPHSVDQSFVALHVLSFLSRNRIFYQIQIYRAFLNTAGLFSSGISSARFSGTFTPITSQMHRLFLPLRTLKASQVFSTDKSPNFKAYLQTSAAAFE